MVVCCLDFVCFCQFGFGLCAEFGLVMCLSSVLFGIVRVLNFVA